MTKTPVRRTPALQTLTADIRAPSRSGEEFPFEKRDSDLSHICARKIVGSDPFFATECRVLFNVRS